MSGALSWLFYFVALKYGLATKVVVIDRLSLVFVIALAALFLGEALTGKVAIGALLMIVGAIIITVGPHIGTPRRLPGCTVSSDSRAVKVQRGR